jgi:hypothetical protein
MDPDQPISLLQTMDDVFDRELANRNTHGLAKAHS